MKTKEIREMSAEARAAALKEAHNELLVERGVASMGGAPRNPGRIRDLRQTVARILTVNNEEARQR